MSIYKASEIPRNEAYIEVRRSASGPEGLRPGGTRDEGNAALRCFDLAQGRKRAERPFGFAQGHEPVEWQMGVFRQPHQLRIRKENQALRRAVRMANLFV